MSCRDIIVIGSSAGGLRALTTLFSGLPADLPASVFVVLHTAPSHRSMLAELLDRKSPMKIVPAEDGERIFPSRVYVAPSDRHLLLERGHMHLSAGPRENLARPAINPLFRSAALTYGPRVIGVILTGLLDDGTLGLWEVKRRGGMAIVQEPGDAEHYQMPASAVRNVPVDERLPLVEIAPRLVALAGQAVETPMHEARLARESEATGLTCPECYGPLRRMRYGEGDVSELRCRVGHTYSPETAVAAHDEAEERTLWSAVEMLEEGADFAALLADALPGARLELDAKIATKRRLARQLRAEIEAAATNTPVAIPLPQSQS